MEIIYGGGVTIDGTEVEDDISLETREVFQNTNLTVGNYAYQYRAQLIAYKKELHRLGSVEDAKNNGHHKWNGSYWVDVSTLPYSTGLYSGSTSIVVLNNEIHILGGYGNDNVKHYKWDGTRWSMVSTLPYGFGGNESSSVYCSSAVVLNNEIHIFGSDYEYTNSNVNSKKHYKWNGTEWIYVDELPFIPCATSVVLNNEIHILGSLDDKYTHYKWDGTSWVLVSRLPISSLNNRAVILNNQIHVLFGGIGKSHYKWDGNVWTELAKLPLEVSYCGKSAVFENGIHHINGASNTEGTYGHYIIEKIYLERMD